MSKQFDVLTDIPNLSDRVIIVTGGNSGLGKEMVLQLVKHEPKTLYLTARSKDKFDLAIDYFRQKLKDSNEQKEEELINRIEFLELDLTSLKSVKNAANQILSNHDRLDLLINNAGIMATPPGLTKDGYEIQFGTNHLGHAYFTKLLLPLLEKTVKKVSKGQVRIINLSSIAESFANSVKGFNPELVKTEMKDYLTFTRYGQSKISNIYFSRLLAKNYPNIISASVHPGRVETELTNSVHSNKWTLSSIMIKISDFILVKAVPVSKGALSPLWVAFSQEVQSGSYYVPIGIAGKESKLAKDMKIAENLWNWQEKEFEEFEKNDK